MMRNNELYWSGLILGHHAAHNQENRVNASIRLMHRNLYTETFVFLFSNPYNNQAKPLFLFIFATSDSVKLAILGCVVLRAFTNQSFVLL